MPLSFTPYKIGPDGLTNHAKAMDAVDQAFDRYEGDMPEHVHRMGKAALYAEVNKQALRNMAPAIHFDGCYTPDRLLAFMAQSDQVLAGELARYTDIEQTNADQRIHEPVLRSLRENPALDTVELAELPYLKSKPSFESEELISVEVKQKRMEHFQAKFTTSSRLLLLVDMLDKRNPIDGDLSMLAPVAIAYVNGQEERPPWLLDSVSTYYTYDRESTDALEDAIRESSPNLRAWQKPDRKPKPQIQ